MEGYTIIPASIAEVTRDHPSNKKELFVLEDYNQRISIATVMCIVSLVGTIGNVLVITAVVLSRRLRSSTNWFIVNLGCADLLACLIFPFNVVAMISRHGWPLPSWICATSSALFHICLGASVMTLALIAYNRWYLLTKPMARFQKFYTTRKICLMLLSSWMYPSLLVLVPYYAGLGRLGYSYEYKSCSQDTSLPTSDLYSLIAGAGVIIPIFITIVAIYVRIYLFVSRQSKKMGQAKSGVSKTRRVENISLEMSSSKISSTKPSTTSETLSHSTVDFATPHTTEKTRTTEDTTVEMSKNHMRSLCGITKSDSTLLKPVNQYPGSKAQPPVNRYHVNVTKRLAIVVLAFFICMLPFGISVVVPPSDPGIPWTVLLMTFNSCINPLIYARTMPEFRKVMWAIIRCRLRRIPEPLACIRRIRSF